MTEEPERLPATTKLSVERTRLSHDRTLLSWVRTATSLISFGFTIYKGFQYLHESGAPHGGQTTLTPRSFALVMIGVGVAILGLAVVDHRRDIQALRAEYGGLVPYSRATIVAGLITLLGLLGLVAVAFRL